MVETRKIIAYLAIKNNLEWEKTMQDIKGKVILDEEDVEGYFEVARDNFITIIDKDYPEPLKNVYQPPFMFYYEGDKSVLNDLKNKVFISNLKRDIDLPINDIIFVAKVSKNWKIFIGTKLVLWFGGSLINTLRIAMCMANKVVITETIKEDEPIIEKALCHAISMDKDIYCTIGKKGSLNNRLIKEGAMLVETKEDLR